jgi:hypothetical protein
MTAPTERYLPVKQLAAELRMQYGLIFSEQFIRAALQAGVPRIGNSARLSELIDWFRAHPDFSPRSKDYHPGVMMA